MIPYAIESEVADIVSACIASAVDTLPNAEEYDTISDYYDEVRDLASEYATESCDVIYTSEGWDIVSSNPAYFEDVAEEYFGQDWLQHMGVQDLSALVCSLATYGILHAAQQGIAEDCARAAIIEA